MAPASRYRRGLLLGAIMIVLGGVLFLVDTRLRNSEGAGYCPPKASWIVAAFDAPAFLSHMDNNPAARHLMALACSAGESSGPKADGLPPMLAAFLEDLTGRPASLTQWRRWFGTRFLASCAPEGWGICVRPGLLLHASEPMRHILRRSDIRSDDDYVLPAAIKRLGATYYAWHNGYLIVSSQVRYVAACLKSPKTSIAFPQHANEILLHWLGNPRGIIRVRGQDGIPVSGTLDVSFLAHRETPLSLPNAWLDAPLISITASTWTEIQTLVAWLPPVIGSSPILSKAASRGHLLAQCWDWEERIDLGSGSTDEISCALMDIDTSLPLPVPEAALILRSEGPLRGSHPLTPLIEGIEPTSFEWCGLPGVVAPLLGEKLSLCLGRYHRDWLAATRESLMAKLAGGLADGMPVSGDLALAIDWRKLGLRGEALTRCAAEYGFIPHMNTADAEKELIPWLRSIAQLGQLQLVFHGSEKHTTFEGFFALNHEIRTKTKERE